MNSRVRGFCRSSASITLCCTTQPLDMKQAAVNSKLPVHQTVLLGEGGLFSSWMPQTCAQTVRSNVKDL